MIGRRPFAPVACALAALLLAPAPAAAAQPKVMVTQVTAARVSRELLDLCADRVRGLILEGGRFSTVGREEMDVVRDRALGSLRGEECNETACYMEMAGALGARYAVFGKLAPLGKGLALTLQFSDMQDMKMVGSVTEKCPSDCGDEAIVALVEAGARSLLASVTPKVFGAPKGRAAVVERRIGGGAQELEPEAGEEPVVVSFDSTPPGAVVLVDQELLCQSTPCSKELLPGRHAIAMQKERYQPAQEDRVVQKGAKVAMTLAPAFGWLSVETVPAGLPLSVNGRAEGASPLRDKEVDPGGYEVVVDDPCWLREGEKVAVKVGERRALRIEAHARMAAVRVSAEDDKGNAVEARVKVDGQAVGTAPGTFKVAACAKEVVVEAEGKSWKGELTLRERETVAVKAVLGAQAVDGGTYVDIPGGSFSMGCVAGDTQCDEDEKPAKTGKKKKKGAPSVAPRVLRVSAFRLMRTEVTAGAYEQCVKAGACTADTGESYCNYGRRGDHPINCVDWNQATAFCKWSGGRLPTAAEWEYAAKGGQDRIYPWGNEAPTARHAKFDSTDSTAPVGSYPAGASRWGLFDMAGNVREWTATDYGSSKKELRGGSWIDNAWYQRASDRDWGDPPYSSNHVGVRCAQ